ncbi:MAG TPA: GntR family transcriptional regulator [Novosphingobium sp.]|nr:GntR family transcriptional regulator [Novosphingobium sp.]
MNLPLARSPRSPKPGQRVMVALRHMIVTGEIADGARIAEIPTAERLGVSRMPVRTALRALALEGLVVPLGKRGYAARRPDQAMKEGALQVRGVLEGLAARLVAQAPDHAATGARLAAIIAPCAGIGAQGRLAEGALALYAEANAGFHAALLAACTNGAIGMALAQNDHIPLASAVAFAFDTQDEASVAGLLAAAHAQHAAVARAIAEGAAEAAEALMRSHAEASLAMERGLAAEPVA